jgi:transposase
MKRFIEGAERHQSTFLPECLDDWVEEDNPVRAVDAFVNALDLAELGFRDIEPAATGRPSCYPATLLKLYIYRYLNHIQSSRRLERECQRNVELIWLTERLAPDFKTTAGFRRNNGTAICAACAQFIVICPKTGILTRPLAAIESGHFYLKDILKDLHGVLHRQVESPVCHATPFRNRSQNRRDESLTTFPETIDETRISAACAAICSHVLLYRGAGFGGLAHPGSTRPSPQCERCRQGRRR